MALGAPGIGDNIPEQPVIVPVVPTGIPEDKQKEYADKAFQTADAVVPPEKKRENPGLVEMLAGVLLVSIMKACNDK